MSKKKLIHFQENLTFPHLFQPKYHDLFPHFFMMGQWQERYFGNQNPVVVELGCGKGEYTVGMATRNAGSNYIGIDWKGARLWRGCRTVADEHIKNVAFIRTQIGHIEKFFAPGEISAIWITFPDPQVKKERCRLTSPLFLDKYHTILSPGGIVHLKTDDAFFYEYSLDVILKRGHKIIENITDVYSCGRSDELVTIQTFYEKMWLEMGKKIYYLSFQF